MRWGTTRFWLIPSIFTATFTVLNLANYQRLVLLRNPYTLNQTNFSFPLLHHSLRLIQSSCQQACAPMFLRLTHTASGRYVIRCGTLLCTVPTRNSAPAPSRTQNRNSTRVGALRCFLDWYGLKVWYEWRLDGDHKVIGYILIEKLISLFEVKLF